MEATAEVGRHRLRPVPRTDENASVEAVVATASSAFGSPESSSVRSARVPATSSNFENAVDPDEHECVFLNSEEHIDLETGERSAPFEPADPETKQRYIEEVIAERSFEYEKRFSAAIDTSNLVRGRNRPLVGAGRFADAEQNSYPGAGSQGRGDPSDDDGDRHR